MVSESEEELSRITKQRYGLGPALVFLVASATVLGQGPPPTGPQEIAAPDCVRWSLQGARLGMPIAEFRKLQPKLKREGGWLVKPPQGTAAYSLALDRIHGSWLRLLTDRTTSEEPIQSMMLLVGDNEAEPLAVISALADRWGPPTAPRQQIGKMTFFNALGTVLETPEYVTVWNDSACDVRGRVEDSKRLSPGPARIQFELISVFVESIAFTDRLQQLAKEKAAESVRP